MVYFMNQLSKLHHDRINKTHNKVDWITVLGPMRSVKTVGIYFENLTSSSAWVPHSASQRFDPQDLIHDAT